MKMNSILVVDDEPMNLQVLMQLLSPQYRVRACKSGADALRILSEENLPDLLLLDILMPGMDGYETLSNIKSNPLLREIPVIFISALDSTLDEEKGFVLGAEDYISKPFKAPVVRERVRVHMELKTARDQQKTLNDNLEKEVARRVLENQMLQDATLNVIIQLAETRDMETGNHILRTRAYVEALGKCMQSNNHFGGQITDEYLSNIIKAAPLHDIGKIGVPDTILMKPGKLTEDEFEVMKTHCVIGGNAITEAIRKSSANQNTQRNRLSPALEYLLEAKNITVYHHERWDGKGYPYGLKEEDIPLSARIMALADVFDALTSERPYKKPWSMKDATDYILGQRGKQFDPDVVDAFNTERVAFELILHRLSDKK